MTFPEDVTVAILSYNSLEDHLKRCVRAAIDAGCPPDQLLVVDNASTDGTKEWMAENWPQVRCAVVEVNVGPNRGRNRGLAEARTPFVMLMDVDNELLPGVAGAVRELFDRDPQIAIAAPLIVYPDRPHITNYALAWFHYLGEATALLNDRPIADFGDEPLDCGTVTGCTMMIRKSTADEIDGFDEDLYFGKEDGEFCYRATMMGYRVVVTPKAHVLHHHLFRGDRYYNHQIAGRWYFILKNYQWSTLLLCAPALVLHELCLLLFLALKGRLDAFGSAIRHFVRFAPRIGPARARAQSSRKVGDAYLLRGDDMLLPPHKGGALGAVLKGYAVLVSGYWSIANFILRLRGHKPSRVVSDKPDLA